MLPLLAAPRGAFGAETAGKQKSSAASSGAKDSPKGTDKKKSGGASKTKKAEAAFQRGITAYKAGKMDKAVQEFRRANSLKPTWKIQYNIGQCEAALRRYGLAIEAFELYLGQGGDEVPKPRQDEVLQELDRMRRMVGTIVVKGESGIDIYVDKVIHGNTSVRPSVQVTAGVQHEITFIKAGKQLGAVSLVVSGGEVVELPVGSKQASTVSVSPMPPTQNVTPQVQPASATVPLKAPGYTTMRQIKNALRAQQITKEEYRAVQQEIRRKRQMEYDAFKAELSAGTITKQEYEQKIRACRLKYEGD
jgi:hypothetical protein